MIGHLGTRASALLDGQLPTAEAERLWAHVYGCHLCRDLVEREGWVKTRLSGLSSGECPPPHLKGAILGACSSPVAVSPVAVAPVAMSAPVRPRRALGVAAGVGGAAGVAVMGVLALGAAPADAPTGDRRIPATNLNQPVSGNTLVPVRRETRP